MQEKTNKEIKWDYITFNTGQIKLIDKYIDKYWHVVDFKRIENEIYYNEFEWKKSYDTKNKEIILKESNAERLIWPTSPSSMSTDKFKTQIIKMLKVLHAIPKNYDNYKKMIEYLNRKIRNCYAQLADLRNHELTKLDYQISLNNFIFKSTGHVVEKTKFEQWTPFQLDIDLPKPNEKDKEVVEHYISIFAKTPKERKHFLMLFSLGLSNYNNGVMTIIYGQSNVGKSQWFTWFTSLLNEYQVGFISPDALSSKDKASFRDAELKLTLRMDDIPHKIDSNNEAIFKTILTSTTASKHLDFRKLYSNISKRLNCGSFFATANNPLYIDYNAHEFSKRVKHFYASIDKTHKNYKAKYDNNTLFREMTKGEKAYLLWELLNHFKFNFHKEYYGKGALPMMSKVDDNVKKAFNADNAIMMFWEEHGDKMHLQTIKHVYNKFREFLNENFPSLYNKVDVTDFRQESMKIKGVEYKRCWKNFKNMYDDNVHGKTVWFYEKVTIDPSHKLLPKNEE